MDVRILGVVEAATENEAIPLGARKQKAVLAMLAVEANTPVSADRIAEGLWGETLPPSGHKMVQLYVHQLRKALRSADARIVTRGKGYELVCGADDVDMHRAERLLAAAMEEPVPNGHAREALALWRGPALADVADEPFAAEPIRYCEELRLRAHEMAIDADLARGRHADVLAEVAALAAEHPLREHLQAQHLLALYRSGRQAEALEEYRAVRERLVEAVGAEPGPELRRIQEAMLHHDDAIAPPPPERRAGARRRRGYAIAATAAAAALALAVAVAVAGSGSDPAPLRLGENAAGLLDPGGGGLRTVEHVGRGPEAAAIGGGSVWVANALDGTVTRIDREDGRRLTISVGPHPTALAFGAGSLWVVSGDDGAVAQVDPITNRVAQRIPVGGEPAALAVGFGAVWVAEPREDVVARIDLTSGRVTHRIAAGPGPAAVAAGAGAVWVAAEDADEVIRIDPRTGTPTAATGVGHGPAAVAAGDGAVWVANATDGTVSRIDPATATVTGTVRVGQHVTALTADGKGAVAANERGEVLRIEGTRIASRLRTGSAVRAIASGSREVWVAAAAAPAPHRGGTLTTFSGPCGDPCAVDPAFALQQTYGSVGLAYDGLVGYRRAPGAAGSTIEPMLATAVPAPSAGGRTYTFTLRPGLRFSDGRPVRASDVRFSLERSIRVGHELVPGLLGAIRGADACERLPATCSLASGVVADDRTRTVTIRLRRADPLLLHKLANPAASIVPAGTSDRLQGPRPPGTGPYRIVSVAADGTVRLTRNPHFTSWSPARPGGFADIVVVRPWVDLRPRLAAVERGRADVTSIDNGGAASPRRRARRRAHPAPRAGGRGAPARDRLYVPQRPRAAVRRRARAPGAQPRDRPRPDGRDLGRRLRGRRRLHGHAAGHARDAAAVPVHRIADRRRRLDGPRPARRAQAGRAQRHARDARDRVDLHDPGPLRPLLRGTAAHAGLRGPGGGCEGRVRLLPRGRRLAHARADGHVRLAGGLPGAGDLLRPDLQLPRPAPGVRREPERVAVLRSPA